jgi:hypothetical protein
MIGKIVKGTYWFLTGELEVRVAIRQAVKEMQDLYPTLTTEQIKQNLIKSGLDKYIDVVDKLL